jgi:cytochrome c556
MRRLALAVSALALGVLAVHADPIEDRETLMKSFGKAVGALAPIAKGEKAFDAAEAHAGLVTLAERAAMFDVAALFPAGSTNDKSTASPKIWEDMAGFQTHADKFKADTAAAAATPPADLAAFIGSFATVTEHCGGCHKEFRIKKD